MEGGKAYGKGAFGAVYGDPPPPCENAKPTSDDTVGKVFFGNYNQESANEEFQIFKTIRQKMSPEDFHQFRKVAFTPLKLCKVDPDQIARPPYTDAKWRKTDGGETINALQPKPQPMIIYEKAKSDLGDYIQNHANEPLALVHKTRTLFQAVNLLHKYDICHLDIKTGNVLVSQNDQTFRLADFGKATPVSPTTENNLTYYPGYFPHPSCVVFILPAKTRRATMNQHLFSEFNINNYYYIHQFLYLPFLPMRANSQFGFNAKQKSELANYAKQLNLQKFFGFEGFWNALEKVADPRDTAASEKALKPQIEKYRAFMDAPRLPEPYNSLMQGDHSDKVVSLYKKTDQYSLGIILLEILGAYHEANATQPQTAQMCARLMKIYRLAFSCCNYIGPKAGQLKVQGGSRRRRRRSITRKTRHTPLSIPRDAETPAAPTTTRKTRHTPLSIAREGTNAGSRPGMQVALP